MTLSWLVAGGASFAFSLVVATIGRYGFDVKNGSALVVALGLLIATFASVHALREHRRELFAWRIATAARAIAASRFQFALRVLEHRTQRYETVTQGGAANWIHAYAALHDGRTDEAIRLCDKGTHGMAKDRSAFLALRALAFAVRRDATRSSGDIDVVRSTDRASSFDLALCDLAHGLNARAMPTDRDDSSELLLLDADVALLRHLRHRTLEPYRAPVRDFTDAAAEEDGSGAIRKWIAVALHEKDATTTSTMQPETAGDSSAMGEFRHNPIGREAGALFGLAVTCSVPVMLVAYASAEVGLMAFIVAAVVSTCVFGLPLLRQQPSPDEPAGNVAVFRETQTPRTRIATEPAASERQIESELFAELARARDFEAKGESGAALTLADKCIWRIDSRGFDWAATVLLPELIAVRARCLAMLGLPAEAEHEIGELRKHFEFALTPVVEWQVDLRSSLVRGDHARVLILADQTPADCTAFDRDLLASVIAEDEEEAPEEMKEAKRRRG